MEPATPWEREVAQSITDRFGGGDLFLVYPPRELIIFTKPVPQRKINKYYIFCHRWKGCSLPFHTARLDAVRAAGAWLSGTLVLQERPRYLR